MKKNTVRIAWFGVFTALALIFSYVETLIPFQIGIPGVKLGLANLIVVVALYKMGGKDAMLLSVTRIVLSGFIFASLFSILYSLAGGLLSLAVMVILKKRGSFSVFGVSMAGGVFHNVGQLIVAMLVVETFSVAYYVPVLLIAGVITGFIIGVVANEMLKRTWQHRIVIAWEEEMISYIRGELVALEEDKVIVDVGGVGYGIFMSGQAMGQLPPVGSKVKIHTYLNVKEDAMQLYGFLNRDALSVFKLLIGVSGIGPKGGLGILAQLTPDELRFAVMSKDIKAISAAPGIGKKTAEKLIVELKDKLKIEDVLDHQVEAANGAAEDTVNAQGLQADAVQALTALGYGSTEALQAVRKVEMDESTTVEDLLKGALKYLI